MSKTPTNTYGGERDQTAIINHAPEHRDWKPGDPWFEAEISEGVRIEKLVTIDAGMKAPTYIGPRTWLLAKAHVGHDAAIGADCEISTGAIIGGHAIIGAGTRVGLNAVVLPGVKVGQGARIGAGAVVTRNIPPGETWAGVPACRLEQRTEDEVLSTFNSSQPYAQARVTVGCNGGQCACQQST